MTESLQVPLLLSSSSSSPWFDEYADSRYDSSMDSDHDDDDDDEMDAVGRGLASVGISGPIPFRTRYPSNDDDEDEDDDNDTDSIWLACLASVHSLSTHNDAKGHSNNEEDPIMNNEVDRDEQDKSSDNDDDDENAWWWCTYYQVWSCIASGLLWPLLLWLQFAVAWRYPKSLPIGSHDNDHDNWASVQSSIVCFVLASILYRYSLEYHCSSDNNETRPMPRSTTTLTTTSWWAIGRALLAEICTNVILGLVLFQYVATALAIMRVATLLLVLAAVLASTCSCTVHISNEPMSHLFPMQPKLDDDAICDQYDQHDSDQVYGMLNITIV
jgi:hypothetical protein